MPSIHSGWFTSCNSTPGDPVPASGLCRHLHSHAHNLKMMSYQKSQHLALLREAILVDFIYVWKGLDFSLQYSSNSKVWLSQLHAVSFNPGTRNLSVLLPLFSTLLPTLQPNSTHIVFLPEWFKGKTLKFQFYYNTFHYMLILSKWSAY